MALFHNLRYAHYIVKLRRRLRSFLILALILLVLFGAGTFLKNLVLRQLENRIKSTLGYERAYISTFPPALVMEDVRSVSSSPFFSARKVLVKMSFRSLFAREKPFELYVEDPVLRIFAASGPQPPGQTQLSLAVPFIVNKALIRGGEVYYWGRETRVFAQDIYALFRQDGNDFSLKAELNDNTFIWDSAHPPITGRVELVLEGRGDEIQVRKLRLESPGGVVKAKGQLLAPLDPQFELETSYNLDTPLLAKLFGLPFEWRGRGEGRGVFERTEAQLSFRGGLRSTDLILNRVPLGLVQSAISFQAATGGTIDLNVSGSDRPPQFLRIRFNRDRVEGTARGVFLDPVMNDFDLPWPVASPVWGTFTVRSGRLEADAEFRDELELQDPERFPFNGRFRLDWDGVESLEFYAADLDSSFARVELEGSLKVDREVDMTIRGDVKDAIQARRFTELVLEKNFEFPEIRGAGQAELSIFGDVITPQIKAEFSVRDAGFGSFAAAFVKGEAELIRERFFGRFEVDDPLFQGRLGLYTDEDETRTEIWVEKGRVETILPAMDIQLPLRGEASGHFSYQERNLDQQYEGSFTGDRIDFGGQELARVKGKIEGDAESVHFPELEFDAYGGHVEGRMSFWPLDLGFDVDLVGREFDLNTVYPSLQGKGMVELKGKGTFGQEVISGAYSVQDMLLIPFQPTSTRGEIKLDYNEERIYLELKGGFEPGQNAYTAKMDFALGDDTLAGEFEGRFTNMDLLLPWKGAQAQIKYTAGLKGPRANPEINGAIDIEGSVLPFPRFAHAFRDFSALVFVQNRVLSIRNFQGRFGGGEVSGSGTLSLGPEGVETIDVTAEGNDMVLSLMERTAARTDGTARLLKQPDRFVMEGDFRVERVNWRREVTEKFSFSSSAYQLTRPKDQFFDDLTLNIRLRAEDDAWMDNTLGRLRTRFDLTISGNIYNPVLFGDIEIIDGNVEFQDRSFDVLNGRISFFNPAAIEPYISFQVENYIKDYRVTIRAEGLVNRDLSGFNLEFMSSPPLPPEDVLALISLGESFQRTYQYEQTMGQGTASLLTFTLSEEAKRSAQRFFSIDQFRIDPYILGSSSEVTARLTVGKRLSRSLFILYATNLTTERKDIVRMELELSRDLSLVGIRDENGRFSLDLKIHKRF
jgi:hypothetical protein